jgi:hypothetical protein
MKNLWRGLWQAPDQDNTYYRQWVANAQGFNGAVIAYIEGIIILGALEFAISQGGNWALWLMYGAAYLTILALSSTYAKAALVMALNGTRLTGKHRMVGLTVIGITATAFNLWLTFALSTAVGAVIESGLAN